jgi:PilZ domain
MSLPPVAISELVALIGKSSEIEILGALHPGVDYETRIADEVTAESSGRCRQIHGSFRLKFRGIHADMRIETAKVRTPPQAFAGESELLKPENQPATGPDVSEVRRKPRFKLAVHISIHSPSCGLLKGSTLDISEIGVGAVLGEDVPVGEIVKLNIPLPSGPLTICATPTCASTVRVRQTLTASSSYFLFSYSRKVGLSDDPAPSTIWTDYGQTGG